MLKWEASSRLIHELPVVSMLIESPRASSRSPISKETPFRDEVAPLYEHRKEWGSATPTTGSIYED